MENKQKEYSDVLEKSLAKDLLVLDTAISASRTVLDLCEDETTFNFNSLDVLKVGEIHLTRTLAWLLDLNESHRQKDIFLKKFLKECCNITIRTDFGKFAYVSAEEAIGGHGRLDIIIEFEKYSIIIENKLWGKDDPGQLDKYIKWCEERGKAYKMVFLTMDDQDIANSQLWEKEKHIQLTYKEDIHRWLKGCRKKCSAQKITNFISEMLQWIEFNIKVPGGGDVMSEAKVLEKLITEDQDKFKMLWNIIDVFDLKKYLNQDATRETRELLIQKMEGHGYIVTDDNDKLFSKTQTGWMCFKQKNIKNIPISYAIQSENWNEDVIIGISKDEKNGVCFNEQQIFDCLRKTRNSTEENHVEKNSWWVGYFTKKIIEDAAQNQCELQMAWHLSNPEKREVMVNGIVDIFKELIQATKDIVPLSTSNPE